MTLSHIFFTIVSFGIFSNKFFSSSFNIKSKSLAVYHFDSPISFLIRFTDAMAIFEDDKKSLKIDILAIVINVIKRNLYYLFLNSVMNFFIS